MGIYLRHIEQRSEYDSLSLNGRLSVPYVVVCDDDTTHYMNVPSSNVNVNGYDYVDLGLPSGTLWAKTNIGSTSISNEGAKFAFGEIEPKSTYTWGNYKYGYDSADSAMTKYNATDGLSVLSPEDDIVHLTMGGDWVMPDLEAVKELYQNTTLSYGDFIGTSTRYAILTSKINGKQLWFVADALCFYIWSSSVYDANGKYKYLAYTLGSEDASGSYRFQIGDRRRYEGTPVRGCIVPQDS